MKIYFSCILLILLFVQCNVNKNQIQSTVSSRFTYSYDTIYKTYKGDFTKSYTGGIDLLFKDSTTFIAYNYCGANQIRILDHGSDSVKELNQYNPDCSKVYTSVKGKDYYLISLNGDITLYCSGRAEGEVIYNLFSNPYFKKSGLVVEWYKAGGDQYIDIPEEVLYFRVNQDFDNTKGVYSKKDHNYPNFAKFNLRDSSIQFFGNQPAYVVNDDFGLLSLQYDLYIGHSIITSEAMSGKITIIDTKGNTKKMITVKSTYDTVPIKKYRHNFLTKDRKNKKMQHALYSANYESLFYNPFTKQYYRIFHPEMAKYNEEELLNTNLDKQCVLMVFDSQFNLLDEVLLPVRRSTILKLFPIKDGVEFYMPDLYKIDSYQKKYSFLQIHHK